VLPWQDLQYGDLATPDEIRLVVPRPTLKELQSKRHLRSTMQRAERVLDELRYKPTVLRSSNPTVSVRSTRDPQPSPEAMEAAGLDPAWNDDCLIMFARTYAESHANVVLLTADGPLSEHAGEQPDITSILLSKARYGDWFLPDEPQVDVPRLQQRVALLEAASAIHIPAVRVSLGTDSSELTAVHVGTLTADEWSTQRHRLEAAFPRVTNFGSVDLGGVLLAAGRSPGAPQLVSATAKDISEYMSAYVEWLEFCESEAARFRRMPACVPFAACLENTGTAHARTVEVSLEGLGCQIRKASDERPLPSPLDFDNVASYLCAPEAPPKLSDLLKQHSIHAPPKLNPDPDPMVAPARSRDRPPGQFEYTTDTPTSFQERLSLDCPLWPHGKEPVAIPLWIALKRESVAAEAQAQCAISVHVGAENIPEPVHTVLPVNIAIRHLSGVEHAGRLVDTIIGHCARK